MTIRVNGKKLSKKAAEEFLAKTWKTDGKKKLQERIQEARETSEEDPQTEISWMDGMSIEI